MKSVYLQDGSREVLQGIPKTVFKLLFSGGGVPKNGTLGGGGKTLRQYHSA